MVVGAAIGLLALIYAIPMCVLAIRKRFWLSTQAIIVGADVKNVKDIEGSRLPHLIVFYEYQVGGVQFFGSDSIPIEAEYCVFQEKVEELAASYPPGDKIEIFYPENNPAVSSARRSVLGLSKAIFSGTVGVFLTVVLYFYWYAATGQKG